MNDPKNTVVRYVRYPITRELVGCVVAINTPDGIKYGWSQRNKVDTFAKRTGRNIAIQRALFPPSKEIKPAFVKFDIFSPFTGKVVQRNKIDLVGEALEDLRKFAENVAFAKKPKRPEASELPEGLTFNEDKTAILDATGKVVARIVGYDPEDDEVEGFEDEDEECDGNCGDRNCPSNNY